MVTAIILMTVDRKRINELAQELADIEGVSECYSVGGSYDLVALIRVRDTESLADLVTRQMAHLEGIEHTETLIAFQAHSRHDLENMFSVGL
ncbi:DNA-binding Lrp family transcriptional regulator [Natronocella acetinitrilica]|uniref:DNA-binding Lrp family transcriptional regulator n=1 Tax=Natronocella acetinitrilica TaxID=414046 RepID=A0AAE3G2K5_9GAMM|nr:Lrp/AsnC ligand binding domain-containing protein [Natronocella acetinitrilica]MCP1674665.1 DNA-binding Lrp family transcriptional regulator [Natronocella acetinitrilica]